MADQNPDNSNYHVLDADKIVKTLDQLSLRISDRFGECGLFKICRKLLDITSQAKRRSAIISQPFLSLRIFAAVIIVGIIAASVAPLFLFELEERPSLLEFIGALEPGMNVVIIVGAAILFVITLEIRVKRKRALNAIHEIRSVAHIVDMHQLTKDPDRLRTGHVATSNSPELSMSAFELGRYLDYCCEMLSLTGKVAALYIQHFDDSVAIASANEVETLCTGLSRKIWQKIMLLGPLTDDQDGKCEDEESATEEAET